MRQQGSSTPQAIDWGKYQGYGLVTADGVDIGVVSSVSEAYEDGERFFNVEDRTGLGRMFRVPVSAIGVISKTQLLLDVVVDNIDFLETGERETSDSTKTEAKAGFSMSMNRQVRSQTTSLATLLGNRGGHEQRGPATGNGYDLIPREEGSAEAMLLNRTGLPVVDAEFVEHPGGAISYQRSRGVARRGQRYRYPDRGSVKDRLRIVVDPTPQEPTPYRSPVMTALERRTELLEELLLNIYLSHSPPFDPLSERSGDASADEAMSRAYRNFGIRSLSNIDVVYLFANSVYAPLRQQSGAADDLLATWAICSDGRKVLVHLSSGKKTDYNDWLEHFQSMVARGLPSPHMITTDGTAALIEVAETVWPAARRIRCWIEKMTSVLDEAPATIRPAMKLWLQSIRDAPDYIQGEQLAANMVEKFASDYPEAIKRLTDDLEASLAHLVTPVVHRRVTRSAELGEQRLLDDQTRADILGRLRFDHDPLEVIFKVLQQSPQLWDGVRLTQTERSQLGI